MSDFEKAEKVVDALPGAIDLLTLGFCGIYELVNVIKYDKCKIFIKNKNNNYIILSNQNDFN